MKDNYLNIAFILKDLGAFKSHILPFIKNATKNNCSYHILHINKFYSKKINLNYENINFIDITKNKKLESILNENKIDFLISINPGNILDLFIISVAKILNIPTAYYQHGLQLDFSTFDPEILFAPKTLNQKFNIVKRFSFLYLLFLYNIAVSKKNFFFDKNNS